MTFFFYFLRPLLKFASDSFFLYRTEAFATPGDAVMPKSWLFPFLCLFGRHFFIRVLSRDRAFRGASKGKYPLCPGAASQWLRLFCIRICLTTTVYTNSALVRITSLARVWVRRLSSFNHSRRLSHCRYRSPLLVALFSLLVFYPSSCVPSSLPSPPRPHHWQQQLLHPRSFIQPFYLTFTPYPIFPFTSFARKVSKT